MGPAGPGMGPKVPKMEPDLLRKPLKTLGKSMILVKKVIKHQPKPQNAFKTLVKSTFPGNHDFIKCAKTL